MKRIRILLLAISAFGMIEIKCAYQGPLGSVNAEKSVEMLHESTKRLVSSALCAGTIYGAAAINCTTIGLPGYCCALSVACCCIIPALNDYRDSQTRVKENAKTLDRMFVRSNQRNGYSYVME